jgi:D-methionine transport system substrate-binding protein
MPLITSLPTPHVQVSPFVSHRRHRALAGLAHAQDVIRIGVTAGPHAQIASRGYKISAVGDTVTFPMGFYSKKFKSLADLPEGAKVGIQNDPSNSGRALALLQKCGVIKLKPGAGISATTIDIVDNPKHLQIVQIEAAQLPRSLDDLAASAINTNYAVQANLVPTRDAIAIEDAKSPYANLLAVRTQDKDKPWVAKLVKAFQSPEVKQFVQANFAGSMVPAF